MLYRILHKVTSTYPFVVFWGYVGAFMLAFAFVFVFPPITIVLVFVAVLCVPIVFLTRMILIVPQHMLARYVLKRGACPRCGEFVVAATGETEHDWHCVSCGAHYTKHGEEIEVLPDPLTQAVDHTARLAID